LAERYDVNAKHDIAIVISDMEDGGAQGVVAKLAAHWVAQGLSVAVVTQESSEKDFFKVSPEVTRIVAGGLGSFGGVAASVFRNIWRLFLLRRALKQADADVVFVFVGRTIIQTILASRGLRYRIIACERNDPAIQSLGRFWDWLRPLVYRRADIVTANSQGAINHLATYVPRPKLRLVRNPVRLYERVSGQKREPAFVVVGRLVAQKGHESILRAFASVASRLPDWRLWVIGQGKREVDLKVLSEELGISEFVDWYGLVPQPEPYYLRASVFVSASSYEGMPNAMLEAMSAGLPVIVSDASPGPLEMVHDQESGVVVPHGSGSRLSEAMFELANDAMLRDSLGSAGRAIVEEFSEERVFEVWDELRVEAVGRPTTTPLPG
jgi:GalNAc-alpha-(1->4)-GalNAc-alpha-(1->3)-diNAcBac-PP-undecaprenol alpha-1,4-N-acetyl-D-galactosaminyltransferase